MTEIKVTPIGIIGAGVMGKALMVAIIKSGASGLQIAILDKRSERTAELATKYGCQGLGADKIVESAKNISLVVKPQDMDSLLESIGKRISVGQTVISFAAGKKNSKIENYLAEGVAVLRVMPNTPMVVGVGGFGDICGQVCD